MKNLGCEAVAKARCITSICNLVGLAVKSIGKWSLYLEVDWADPETIMAAPIIAKQGCIPIDGWELISFDSEEEAWEAYNSTVGEDGSTRSNPYNGKTRVYALLFDPNGIPVTENT